jgi:diaminohydroxyphosphoribosylaminopyrimidine deaminase / 5-amino-6-(5-phosphoribosylamino)uracil reductase
MNNHSGEIQSYPAAVPALRSIMARVAQAPRDRPFVVAQLGQSLDGRIATLSGESQWINRECALNHVHSLRAAVDAVIVGVGTVIADDPLLNVRRVAGRHPARVVIDPSGRAPRQAKCLVNDESRRIIVRSGQGAVPDGVEVIQIARENGMLPPGSVITALWDIGLKSFLIEGGARTVSAFLDAGAVDRLHVLVAPVILGSGKPGLSLEPIQFLSQALRPATEVHVLPDGDVLFDCDLRNQQKGADHGAQSDPRNSGGAL